MPRLALLLGLAVALLGSTRSGAQTSLLDTPARDSAEVSASLEIGFAGLYAAERWTPLTVVVSGGRRAFNGIVILDFQQDPTQKARIVAPFASTPGRDVPVPLVAALPQGLEDLTLTVRDDRGRERAKVEYSALTRGDRQLLRGPIGDANGLIVACGRTSFDEAPAVWRAAAADAAGQYDPATGVRTDDAAPTPDQRLASLVVARVPLAALPRAWAAYDGVVAFAAEASVASEMDPRSLEAVRTWVSAGGALILLADAPGSEWRRWFPAGAAGDMLELGDAASSALPPDVATALTEGGFNEAASAPARSMRLTEAGRAQGWCLYWTAADEDQGFLAVGPVGHGMVVVVTLDPAKASAVVSSAAAAHLWRQAAGPILDPWIEKAVVRTPSQPWMSVHADPRQFAVNSTIEQISGAPEFGVGVFLLLGLAAIGLALMLGPGDAFILKRYGLRHRSWLTALVWIAISTGIAYALPAVWRTGPSRLGRFRVIDAAASPDGTPLWAWQSACTGLFASRAGTFTLDGVHDESWWRGVSPLSWMHDPGRAMGAPLLSVQRPGLTPGSPLPALDASIWTFRTLLDESAVTSVPEATITRDGERWRVEVRGLPESVGVHSAALRVGDRWAELHGAPRQGDALVWADASLGGTVPGPWQVRTNPQEVDARFGRFRMQTDAAGGYRATDALALPGADRRSAAIEWRMDSGGWGAVYLHVSGLTPDVDPGDDTEQHHLALLRLLAPLDARSAETVEGAPSP